LRDGVYGGLFHGCGFVQRFLRRLNADAYLTFSLTPQGAVDRIRMKAVSPNTDFSYDFHDLDLQRVAGD
jgi:hypothetical protein